MMKNATNYTEFTFANQLYKVSEDASGAFIVECLSQPQLLTRRTCVDVMFPPAGAIRHDAAFVNLVRAAVLNLRQILFVEM